MPNYREHLAGGVVTFGLTFATVYALCPKAELVLPEVFALTLIGSLFPDMDIKSKIQIFGFRFLFIIQLQLLMWHNYQLAAFVGTAAMVPLIVNHRTLFHSVWFLTLCTGLTAAMIIWSNPGCKDRVLFDTLFFFTGVLSHLLLDYSVRGGKLRTPWKKK